MMSATPDTIDLLSPAEKLPLAAPELREPVSQAAEVFGPGSLRHDGAAAPPPEALSLTDNLPVQMTTLCLLFLYTYIIFTYRREIGQLLSMIFGSRRDERSTDDYSYLFAGFMTGLLVAGYLMVGLAALKITGLTADEAVIASLRRQGPVLIVAAAALIAAAVGILQQLALRIAGVITLSIAFVRRLLALRRLFFAAFTILAAPAALLFALAGGEGAKILVCIFLGIAAILAIYYIYRSLRLFIEERVSILLWILYLCTVEVMPPAMILLATLRSI